MTSSAQTSARSQKENIMPDLAANIERVKSGCEATDFEALQIIALTTLRILSQTRTELCSFPEEVGGEELRAFVFKDNTGMWTKAQATLKAMDEL